MSGPVADFSSVLGTPLSPSANRVMLLGAGELGKEVIIALQRLGAEVIAVDRYPNAPGHQVAHRSHVVNMADPDALRAVIDAERPHIIVPEIEAISTATLVEVEGLGLARVIPTARAAQLTMNREGIRRLAAEDLGLPTSPYRFASSLEELHAAVKDAIGLPAVVKPVMSSSGKGQTRVERVEDLAAAWHHAAAAARVGLGRVIVEGFVEFDYEITLLTVRYLDANRRLSTAFCEPIGHIQVQGDYVESWQPHPMPAAALAAGRECARRVTEALGGLGIFGVELFVRGDRVWFSEVSPRPHDTGLVTLSSQWQNEFELHARALLGLPVDTQLRSPAASSVIYGGIDAVGIAFAGVEAALAVPGTDLRLFGKPESYTKRRMGVALAHAPTVEEARQRAKLAASHVRPHRFGGTAHARSGPGNAPHHTSSPPSRAD
jgi:phosphoribosylglycinamide formyltransferase 2